MFISLISVFFAIIKYDLILSFRCCADSVNPLLFFVLVVTLFPLGGTSPELLQIIAPSIILVSALLATILSLDNLFRVDFADGSLEQLLLSPYPLTILVLGKVIAHWLVIGFPLLVIAPLLAIFLGLPAQALSTLLITLILITPVLSLIGSIGVALTVGLSRGGIIISLLVLPLYIPVLIFASNAVEMAISGSLVDAQINMLIAIFLLAMVLMPLPTAMALRISIS